MKLADFIPIILILFVFFSGASIGFFAGLDYVHTAAIHHNVAHWNVNPNGTTIFEWNK